VDLLPSLGFSPQDWAEAVEGLLSPRRWQ
jgi:hypothetical protein